MYNGAQVIKLDTCPSAPILTCCNVFELLSVFAVPLSEELKREFTLIFFQFVCMIEHNIFFQFVSMIEHNLHLHHIAF